GAREGNVRRCVRPIRSLTAKPIELPDLAALGQPRCRLSAEPRAAIQLARRRLFRPARAPRRGADRIETPKLSWIGGAVDVRGFVVSMRRRSGFNPRDRLTEPARQDLPRLLAEAQISVEGQRYRRLVIPLAEIPSLERRSLRSPRSALVNELHE